MVDTKMFECASADRGVDNRPHKQANQSSSTCRVSQSSFQYWVTVYICITWWQVHMYAQKTSLQTQLSSTVCVHTQQGHTRSNRLCEGVNDCQVFHGIATGLVYTQTFDCIVYIVSMRLWKGRPGGSAYLVKAVWDFTSRKNVVTRKRSCEQSLTQGLRPFPELQPHELSNPTAIIRPPCHIVTAYAAIFINCLDIC